MKNEQNAGVILVLKDGPSGKPLNVDVDTIATVIAERYPSTAVSEARSIILDMADYFGYARRAAPSGARTVGTKVHSLRFAELLDVDEKRLHVGCVMAFGNDWVEVSYPTKEALQSGVHLRFLPSPKVHKIDLKWRHDDRAGFTYPDGLPSDAPQSSDPGSLDPRSAAVKMRE